MTVDSLPSLTDKAVDILQLRGDLDGTVYFDVWVQNT